MPIRNSVPLGVPRWVDLMSSDVKRAEDSTARYLALSLILPEQNMMDTSMPQRTVTGSSA